MLSPDVETLRLSLHVVSATISVGGQITLAALVPALRAAGADVPRTAARAFNRLAWPAFAVLVGTGVWNIADAEHNLHSRARHRRVLAVFGAVTGLSALAALLLGILLAQ